MDEKFAFIKQNENYSFNELTPKLNINALDLSKNSPCEHNVIQAKYDAISVLYAKEIENIAKLFSKTNNINFFSKENFSEIFENFKKNFENLNIDINFYQIKNLDEIISKTSNLNGCPVLIDILNDKNDTQFISNFFDCQNISAINFTNCNISLCSKMSINVDFKKNILNSLNAQEKLKVFLDCVYLSLQTKRALDLKFKIKM